jgi:release factor glutamine methyltransferase
LAGLAQDDEIQGGFQYNPDMVTVKEAQAEARAAASAYSETPAMDAQALLAHVVGETRAWVAAHPEAELSGKQAAVYAEKLAAVQAGTPLPYILGEWPFFGRAFAVMPDVLIPRPETELLIETALDWLGADDARRDAADVGTGSGIIAVTLACEMPDLRVTASDISEAALGVAQENARRHEAAVTFIETSLLHGVAGPFDLIAANLPYIPSEPLKALPIYGREPQVALDGGADGLRLIDGLLADAPRVLKPGGMLLLEIEAGAGEKTVRLARERFRDATMDVLPDLAGHERLVRIQT